MIDTDTRQLRLGQDGFYRSGAGKKICDHCGRNQVCDLRTEFDILRCEIFLPALPFTDETGLDRPSNTMRVGVAWTQRLKIGQRIALYNSKTKTIFGHAIVTNMVAGPIQEILVAHAHSNHMMLDIEPFDAAGQLLAWQRQQYGPHIIHEKTNLTAIFLQRVPIKDASPDHQGDEAGRSPEGGTAGSGQADAVRDGRPADRGGAERP